MSRTVKPSAPNPSRLPGSREKGNLFVFPDPLRSMTEMFRFPHRLEGGGVGLCLKGKCRLSINLNTYEVRENDLIVFTPYSIVQLEDRSDGHTGCALLFTDVFVENLASTPALFSFSLRAQEQPVLALSDEERENLLEYFRFIRNRATRRENILQSLLLALVQEISLLYESRGRKRETSVSRREELVKRFFQLVMRHFKTERRVSFYADKLCLTPKYLSTLVRRTSGKTASQWIDRAVLIYAKALLKSSRLSIQQVADELNFPNPSFFGRFFKQHTGTTPRRYRLR